MLYGVGAIAAIILTSGTVSGQIQCSPEILVLGFIISLMVSVLSNFGRAGSQVTWSKNQDCLVKTLTAPSRLGAFCTGFMLTGAAILLVAAGSTLLP